MTARDPGLRARRAAGWRAAPLDARGAARGARATASSRSCPGLERGRATRRARGRRGRPRRGQAPARRRQHRRQRARRHGRTRASAPRGAARPRARERRAGAAGARRWRTKGRACPPEIRDRLFEPFVTARQEGRHRPGPGGRPPLRRGPRRHARAAAAPSGPGARFRYRCPPAARQRGHAIDDRGALRCDMRELSRSRLRRSGSLCSPCPAASPDPKAVLEIARRRDALGGGPAHGRRRSTSRPSSASSCTNMSNEPQGSIQATAIFRRKGEERAPGARLRSRCPRRRRAAARPARHGARRAQVGRRRYYSDGPPESMFAHAEFKDATVEVFVRVGSSELDEVRGPVDVERRIGAPQRPGTLRSRHAPSASQPPGPLMRHRLGPSAGRGRRAVALPRLPATIGSGPDADVVIAGARARATPCSSSATARSCSSTAAPAAGTFLAGETIQEAVLRAGDVIELGPGGPRLRFERAPTRRAARGDAPHRRRLSQTHGVRAWWPRAAAASAGRWLAVVVVAAVRPRRGASARSRRLRPGGDRLRRRRCAGRRGAARASSSAWRRSAGAADAERARWRPRSRTAGRGRTSCARSWPSAAAGEVPGAARRAGGHARAHRTRWRPSARRASSIIREYGAGVCLIQGAYAFYDATGRPLALHARTTPEQTMRQSDGTPALDPEGDGPVHTVEYYGTGFLVDRRAASSSPTATSPSRGGTTTTADGAAEGRATSPRFVCLRAFFPQPARALRPRSSSAARDTVDLALLRADLRGRQHPRASPRAGAAAAPWPDSRWSWWAIPTGLEAILAKAETGGGAAASWSPTAPTPSA